MTDERSQLEKVLDVLVYAPAGLAQSAGEEFERLAAKGRHRVEGQIHTARLVGQFALQTARSEAQRLFESTLTRLSGVGDDPFDVLVSGVTEGYEESAVVSRERAGRDAAPSGAIGREAGSDPGSNGTSVSAKLAIPGYDSLSASQVVQRLDGLSRPELEEVKEHESAHRRRRTILSRVDQLLAGGLTGRG